MTNRKLLFISMLGEASLYHVEDYKQLCPSGLEKDWIPAWYGDLVGTYGFDMASVDIIRGDAFPPPDTINTAILGGTIHLVLEDRQWLKTILAWLQDYRKLQRPLFAICGGHQMIAVNFFRGNALVKRENGPLLGTYEVQLTENGKKAALFKGLQAPLYFHFANGYHILPVSQVGMQILATTADSPAVAADYGYNWYGCQFHPESRKESWRCYFKQDRSVNIDQYRSEHDGAQLLENFLKIANDAA